MISILLGFAVAQPNLRAVCSGQVRKPVATSKSVGQDARPTTVGQAQNTGQPQGLPLQPALKPENVSGGARCPAHSWLRKSYVLMMFNVLRPVWGNSAGMVISITSKSSEYSNTSCLIPGG